MGIFLEKMMLDFPGVVVTEFVSEFDLGQRILEEVVLGAFGPGSGKLVFVEDAEFHVMSVRLLKGNLKAQFGSDLTQIPSRIVSRRVVSTERKARCLDE